ncbi:MAG: hypothetical protein LUG52_10535 [Clostridia bacterium]|nr:hypothetical protein [Clostridia bacterium]
MAKRKFDAGFASVIIFVITAPLFCTLFTGKALPYIFAAFALFAFVRRVSEKKNLAASKAQLFAYAAALYSTLQLIFVSDKGAQFFFTIVPWLAALMMQHCANAASERSEEGTLSALRTALFVAGVIYAFFNLLYQIFIADGFLAYKMDFASGSSYFSAVLAFCGLLCAISLYKGRKKSVLFYAAAVLLCYTFLFARSSLGCLTAAAILVEYSSRGKKNPALKVIAAAALALSIVWKIASAVRQGAALSTPVNAAFYGISRIFGVGCGGYDASFSALGQGLSALPPTIAAIAECTGVFGLALTFCGAAYMIWLYLKKRSTIRFTACAVYISALFASSEHFIPLAVLLVIYIGCVSGSGLVKASQILKVLSCLLGVFVLYLAAARAAFTVGYWANENENYTLAVKCYTIGANAEIFDSSSWALAAKTAQSAGESESDVALCYEKAIFFNNDSLDFRIELAEVYSESGKNKEALDIWSEIMQMCDSELLYVRYSEKIYAVMEENTFNADYEQELYDLIASCAEKCTDAQIRTDVNDLLSRAQKHLVVSLDGETLPGDLYEEATEFSSEEETE